MTDRYKIAKGSTTNVGWYVYDTSGWAVAYFLTRWAAIAYAKRRVRREAKPASPKTWFVSSDGSVRRGA